MIMNHQTSIAVRTELDLYSRYIEKSVRDISRAIVHLHQLGIFVENISLGNRGKPQINVGYCHDCHKLGEPVTVNKTLNEHSRFQQVTVEGCQVRWVRDRV